LNQTKKINLSEHHKFYKLKMFKTLCLCFMLTLSLNSFRLLQSQELTTQGFANNLGDQKLTQVEANIRSDTEESHSAGFNQSTDSSNSDTIIHGQLDNGDALAGTETISKGEGQGLSQTQNETFSREEAVVGDAKDELTAFLNEFGEDKYHRSINGTAADGYKTNSGAIQKMFNEEDSTRKSSGAASDARYGAGVAGQLSATRYAGKDNTVRNDTSATGENMKVAVRENLWLEGGEIKNAGAAFADGEGPNPTSAASGSGVLDGDGVLSGNTRAEAIEDRAKARSYVTSNPISN
jgi:hypothetical protein